MSDPPTNPMPPSASLPIFSGTPKVKDPVCGMSVDPAKAAGKVEHGGTTHYFCSKRCAERFAQGPEEFLALPGTAGMERGQAPVPATSVPASAPGVRYTCPMHPEVVQIGPGACPICGMALEPMDVFAEVEADPEYHAMRTRFWISAALALPVLLLSMFGDALGLRIAHGVRNVIEFVLATPVVLWGGFPFF